MPAQNSFLIVISAADKATATIRKVNDSVSKLTRPFDEVGKSFKNLGREIGVDKIGKNLHKMGVHARDAAKGIGRIVGPLAGITGIASVAGIVHLADSWANLGRSITYTSQNIGVSTTQLQEFEGAAKMAGLSGSAMAQSMLGLGNTMEDALYGRNQQALMLFNRLGVGIKRTKTGAMDVTAEYDALGKTIYKLKTPQQQWLAASKFGLTAMLPLIRKYHGNMKAATAEAEKEGIVMTPAQIASANQFATALSKLGLQGTVLKNTIGNALIPAMLPLIKELDHWLAENKALIATDVGDWVRDFAKWIKSVDWKEVGGDLRAFIEGVGKVVHALGGVKGILIEIMALKALSFAGSAAIGLLRIGKLTKAMLGLRAASKGAATAEAAANRILGAAGAAYIGWEIGHAIGSYIFKNFIEGTKFGRDLGSAEARVLAALGDKTAQAAIATENAPLVSGKTAEYYRSRQFGGTKNEKKDERMAMAFFMSKGWTQAQAAGIVANIATESAHTFNPAIEGDRGRAYGIGQWHAARQKEYNAWAKSLGLPDIKHSTLPQQLAFYNYELRSGTDAGARRAGSMLANSNNAWASGAVVSRFDERPADMQGNIMSRGKLAEQIDRWYKPSDGPYTAGGAKGADHKVHVQVDVTGLPPGAQAKATTKGATTASARVAHTTTGAAA